MYKSNAVVKNVYKKCVLNLELKMIIRLLKTNAVVKCI
jgi:hypothetical protein